MEMILRQNDAADWVYKGEGAANLVLAYIGSSPTFAGKVIRIQKAANNCDWCLNGKSFLTTHEMLLWRDDKELISSPKKEYLEQLYITQVMSPLLGPKHVDAGIRVLVSREFLECVEKNLICQRPAWRVDAAKVDTSHESVLLLNDHSLFPDGIGKGNACLSVEIKPKCGFIPTSRFITERNAIKRRISRFRMHQVLKLRQKEISEFSEYDPLDLFSESKDKICKAIKALYATPQNNLRVFLNGSLVFGGLGGGTDSTSIATGQAFEEALKGVIQAEDGLRTSSFIKLVAEAIYNSRVLDRVLDVQKLDNLDIEGAIHAYYNIISQPCTVCKELDKERVSLRRTSLHSISLEESLNIVKDYLIAATAKDCSLMISFIPKEEIDLGSSYNYISLESTNQSFYYKAYFLDLDLKPLKKMEEYYELDKKIVTSYLQAVKTEHEEDKCLGCQYLCKHILKYITVLRRYF